MKHNQSHHWSFLLIMMSLIVWFGCKKTGSKVTHIKSEFKEKVVQIVDPNKTTIGSRFLPPNGFSRTEEEAESFASYLRNFSLLPMDAQVHLYNGDLKGNQTAHASILDIDVGNRDLQQCADAVMRLRAEYLFRQERFSDIAFDFTNGWKFEYSKWREGHSLHVSGNKTSWKPGYTPKTAYRDFRKYLNQVFMYAGTLSLAKELKAKKLNDIRIGDVFIKGGSPGHAVIVVDLAIHENTGDKAFLLAQSYMPAQQIHILNNPNNRSSNPWYFLSDLDTNLYTPEWTFDINELKEF
ncbi:MAG: DUF4846 domain-containing protein [Saprospiraceae bacterium]|nr:DUF4846 domain-containing protein [Saprospiraceae bacterium]